MKSKPVYRDLEFEVSAAKHLVIAQGAGIDAAMRLLLTAPEINARLLVLDDGPDQAKLLHDALADCTVDTAFYLTGPERFLWEITRRLRKAGVEQRRIHQEAAGSFARNVYCVHCRTMNGNVTVTMHRCSGCGMVLTVRNHFSRSLTAYMGVVVDAEDPGAVPIPEGVCL